MQKFLLPFSTLALLLLIGAGCQKTTTTTSQESAQDKTTRDQQAYVYCVSRGFTAKVKFDSSINKNRIYCSAEPGQECDVYDFIDGKCDPKKVDKNDINLSLSPLEGKRLDCDSVAKPVCSTDGKTYVNKCTAELQGKKVRYEGICNENDQPFELTPSPELSKTVRYRAAPSPTNAYGSTKTYDSGDSSASSAPAANTAPAPTTKNTVTPKTAPAPHTQPTSVSAQGPEWIPNLTSVLESSTSPYKMTFSECLVGSEKYYYQKEDCANCFKVLYQENGETACYPGLDDGMCPTWSEKSCKVIWEK